MAGRGSGDHLYSQQQPVDPGGGGNSILAAAAKRLRQEMAGRLRPHQPSPPATSAALLPPPSPPLQSKAPSVESLASKTDWQGQSSKIIKIQDVQGPNSDCITFFSD